MKNAELKKHNKANSDSFSANGVTFVPTQRFPRDLYKGPGVEFLRLPESDELAPHMRCFKVQDNGGVVVGAVVMDSHAREASNLFILPDMRNKHHGSALCDAILEYAKKNRWSCVIMNVLVNNEFMLQFLKQAGWTATFRIDFFGGNPHYEVRKEILRGVMGRKPSKGRKWKPVSRVLDTPCDTPPQKTRVLQLDQMFEDEGVLRIYFPTFTDADASAIESAKAYNIYEANFQIAYMNKATHENLVRQETYPFRPNEIRRAMKRILRIKEENLSRSNLRIFAGYTGEFSKILNDQGFDILFTDPDVYYTYVRGEKIGCYTKKCASHRIPKHSNAEAYVSFEGIPALTEQHGMLTYLKALAETRKGLLSVSHYDSPNNPTKPQLIFMSEAYGLGVEDLKTSNLLFTRIFANPRAKRKVQQDLRVVEEIDEFTPKTGKQTISANALLHGGDLNLIRDTWREITTEDIRGIAERLGISEKEVFRSIKRLESAWLLGEAFKNGK